MTGCEMVGAVVQTVSDASGCRSQVIVVAPQGAQPPPGPASSHGLTPPMRDARRRHFRQRIEAPPHVVTRVEADLLAIIRVRDGLGRHTAVSTLIMACVPCSDPLPLGLSACDTSCFIRSGHILAGSGAMAQHPSCTRKDKFPPIRLLMQQQSKAPGT